MAYIVEIQDFSDPALDVYARLTENQLKVLLWHEHLHIGLNDTDGELVYRIAPHDIEEFDPIIRRFGPYWANFGADIPDITEGGG